MSMLDKIKLLKETWVYYKKFVDGNEKNFLEVIKDLNQLTGDVKKLRETLNIVDDINRDLTGFFGNVKKTREDVKDILNNLSTQFKP